MILAGINFDERDLIERVMRNMVSLGCSRQTRHYLVMRTFGVGSTVADALCFEFNLNPDEYLK